MKRLQKTSKRSFFSSFDCTLSALGPKENNLDGLVSANVLHAGLFTGFGRFGSEAARSVRCRLELPRKMQSGHRISPFAFAPSFLTLRFCHIPLALPSHTVTARSCGDHPKLRNKHAQPLLSIPNVDDNEFRDAIKVRCLLSLVEDACYRRRHLRRCLLLLHHGTSNSCGLVPSLLCASVRPESVSFSLAPFLLRRPRRLLGRDELLHCLLRLHASAPSLARIILERFFFVRLNVTA